MQERNHARQEIAAQLRQVRKEQGMTQERLAEKVGTRKSNISRLESGRYNPSLDFLEKGENGQAKILEAKTVENLSLYTSPSPRDRQKSRMPSSA